MYEHRSKGTLSPLKARLVFRDSYRVRYYPQHTPATVVISSGYLLIYYIWSYSGGGGAVALRSMTPLISISISIPPFMILIIYQHFIIRFYINIIDIYIIPTSISPTPLLPCLMGVRLGLVLGSRPFQAGGSPSSTAAPKAGIIQSPEGPC